MFSFTKDFAFPRAQRRLTPPIISAQRAGEVGFILYRVSFMHF